MKATIALLVAIVLTPPLLAQQPPPAPGTEWRQCIVDAPAPPPAAQPVIVNAGDDLQAALNAAQPGQVLQLPAGATFTGNYVLPVKAGTAPITVRSSGTLPLTRVGRADLAQLATLRTANSTPALRTAPGASHWRFDGIAFAAGASSDAVVRFGDGANTDPTLTPRDIVVDRALITADTAKNGLEVHVAEFTLRRSSVLGVKLQGVESHAVITWNGPGPFLIENNLLEAGSCGFFVGGAQAAIAGLTPADITFVHNTVTRPAELRSVTGWAIKNLFELKNAQRVYAAGNVFENNWPDGQSGYAIVLTVRANSATAPWTTVRDVLFEHNVIRHVAAGVNVLGLDNQTGSNGAVYPSQPMDNVVIRNNLVYDLDRLAWTGPAGGVASGVFMQLDGAPRNLHVENNTVAGTVTGNILNVSGPPIPGFVFRRNVVQKSMSPYQTYGVMGTNVGEGNPAFTRYFSHVDGYPDLVFTENVIAGATPATYSTQAGNLFPAFAALQADYVDPASANYRLRTLTGGVDLDALEAASR